MLKYKESGEEVELNNIVNRLFREVDLKDSFFQSLREDYADFDSWFQRKQDENAYVQYDFQHRITGFLYLKVEKGIVDDVTPGIVENRVLKVGTFKIDAHGTKMGEQFVKIILDRAVE